MGGADEPITTNHLPFKGKINSKGKYVLTCFVVTTHHYKALHITQMSKKISIEVF